VQTVLQQQKPIATVQQVLDHSSLPVVLFTHPTPINKIIETPLHLFWYFFVELFWHFNSCMDKMNVPLAKTIKNHENL
jgi:uncharacterized protein with NAD-binding domain and iron-sulfur cluster